MALLDRRLKQRIVGAAVLLALVVVFLPMLFQREDEYRPVRVEAPPMPSAPQVAVAPVEAVTVPEPAEPEPTEVVPVEPARVDPAGGVAPPSQPIAPNVPAAATAVATPTPAVAVPDASVQGRLDVDGLPVSWAVQLASLSNRARAEELQNKLRSQGFTAYIRVAEGMSRVFVGPLLERAEAERVSAQIARQHKLSPIVVRFQPEGR